MKASVLITGASRGIGAATARVFARAGWDVAIQYHSSQDLAEAVKAEVEAFGAKAVVIGADMADPAQAAACVEQAERELGGLTCLVCNAGVALPQQLLTDTTPEQWRALMGVDLDGVFHVVRAAVPHFVRRQGGSIVTVSSMWGVTGGSCEAPYSAAKAGVIGLTKALAKELGPSHIRVNCVAPGVIDTDMNAHLSSEDLAVLGEETPLGRIGAPEEVGKAILFLAGEDASFITGQVLNVDGGMVI
ncbi:MAG: SDR family oxidoreductase [Clostridium sp.]|nr:SDR family oxidoreductase [Clostridium sp.]